MKLPKMPWSKPKVAEISSESPIEEQMAAAMKALPCHRVFSVPIGVSLVGIALFPFNFFMFLFLGFTEGMKFTWSLFNINCTKYSEQSRNAFRGTEGFGACCVCFNKYTGSFFAVLGICLLGIPFFLVVFPLVGAFWASKVSAKHCFRESDMAEEARPDKGGIIANIIDRSGLTDSEKEKCAEAIGEGFCGYILLLVGDWLTLTGMAEGFKTYMEGFEFATGVMQNLVKMMGGYEVMEGFGIKDWFEPEASSLSSIYKTVKSAVMMQFNIYAAGKGFENATEWTQKTKLKKYRGCMAELFGTIGASVAVVTYLFILIKVM
jgi:hypothetical protein